MDELKEELKKAYLVLQENCGIKIGDTVKVLRKAKYHESGWDNSWVQSMDEFIGKECKVVSMEDTGIYLICDEVELGKRGFPFFVLEKVLQDVTVPADTTISLRDQFAGAALTGLLANSVSEFVIRDTDVCYEIADAMLKAREESK